MWNSNHGFYAFVFFIVVTPEGRIFFVSHAMGGSEHDKTHWNTLTGPKELEEKYQGKECRKTFTLGGDKAYWGVKRPDGWANYVTKSAEKEERKEREEEKEKCKQFGKEKNGEEEGQEKRNESSGKKKGVVE